METCLSNCEEVLTSCGDELETLASCVATANYTCGSSGSPQLLGCEIESIPYLRCAFCVPLSDDACEVCRATECCDETEAYLGHADYPALVQCTIDCSELDCITVCNAQYPAVADLATAFAQCRADCPGCP